MNNIFYGKKHPKYQAIELKEELIFINAPKPVNDFLMRNLGLGVTGAKEPIDFLIQFIIIECRMLMLK